MLLQNHKRTYELVGENVGIAAMKSECGQRAHDILIATVAAEVAFHPPSGKENAGRDAIAALDGFKFAAISASQGAAARDPRWRDSLFEISGQKPLEFRLLADRHRNGGILGDAGNRRGERRTADTPRRRLWPERTQEMHEMHFLPRLRAWVPPQASRPGAPPGP